MENKNETGLLEALQPKIVDLRVDKFSPEMLEVGTVFTGILTNIEVDEITSKILEGIKKPGEDHYSTGFFPTLSETLIELGQEQNFHGTFKNFKITIVPPLEKALDEVSEGQMVNATEGLGFVASAEMHSTGRGKIGELTIHSRSFFDNVPETEEFNKFKSVISSPVNTKESKNEIDSLLQSSIDAARKKHRSGLHSISSAGLPTLGKNR